jgi:hypothetical protein
MPPGSWPLIVNVIRVHSVSTEGEVVTLEMVCAAADSESMTANELA